jgi:hypothetical protein
MDPARMFKESLTSHPELENSQGHSRPNATSGLALRTDIQQHNVQGSDGPVADLRCTALNSTLPPGVRLM